MPLTSAAFNATVRVVQENIRLAAELQDTFAREMSVSLDDPPAGAFGMAYNTSVLNLELLDHYLTHWRREDRSFGLNPETPMSNEQIERIHSIGRFVFIGFVSHFEFATKEAVKRWPGLIRLPKKKHIYLRDILEASAGVGLLDDDEFRTWRELIELRNGCTHNNAIFDRDEMTMICGRQVTFRRGRQAQAHLDLFPMCMNWMLKSFDRWGRAYLNLPRQVAT